MRVKFLFCVWLVLPLAIMTQKRNSLSLFTYQYEEFDLDPAAQKSLHPSFANFEAYNYAGAEGAQERAFNYPFSFGLSYQRWLNDAKGVRVDWHCMYSFSRRAFHAPKSSGQSLSQSYTGITSDYLWNLYKSPRKRLWFSLYGGVKGRIGRDVVFIENLPILTHYPERDLRDLGLRAGMIYTYYLPWNLTVSAEAGYSRWLLLYFNQIQDSSIPWNLPRNAFDMRVSIGYAFGKQVPDVDTIRHHSTITNYTDTKNRVSFSAALSYFFDSPGRDWGTHISRSISRPLVGVTYERYINRKIAIQASGAFEAIHYKDYSQEAREDAPQGRTIYAREFVLVSAGANYRLISRDKWAVSIPAHAIYRHGSELFLDRNERVWSSAFDLRDFGLRSGASMTYQVWNSFDVGLHAYYTRFIYRRDLVRLPYGYVKTSPNLATLGLSAGYRF